MNALEELTELLRKERRDALIPFLKGLDVQSKKALAPGLKQLDATYFKFEPISQKTGGTQYGYRSTERQREMLRITFFVCCNQKDFERLNTAGVLKKELLDTILPWYCPGWFNQYINAYADQDFVPYFLVYEWLMELAAAGYLTPSERLIARTLPQAIYTMQGNKRIYQPTLLEKLPVTLNEHLWYLFEHETHIHQDYSKEEHWLKTFVNLAKQNKVPRERLLRAALGASNRRFNQNLSGWFMSLFTRLEPSPAELAALQPELFPVLSAPYTGPVNTVLKYLKALAAEDTLDAAAFADQASMLLASESKAVVTSTLMILEKLARTHQDIRQALPQLACQALIHQDEGLQLRAAKLILKSGDPTDTRLQETLSAYHKGLLFTARATLAAWLPAYQADEAAVAMEPATEPESIETIIYPEDFDAFVYLASQAFDGNQTYHFDLLPAALLRFQVELTSQNIRKLLPSFQRAYKTLTDDWSSSRGYLDLMLATFWTDYSRLLVRLEPEAAEPVKDLYDSYCQKLADKKNDYKLSQLRSTIKTWDLFSHSTGYKPHKHLLLNAWFLLERRISLPLLSTPTHEPSLVAATTLIERLAAYERARTRPGLMDYQVAVMRCFTDDRTGALHLAEQSLKGENLQLVRFLLGAVAQPEPAHELKEVWLAAALTHRPETASQWLAYSRVNPDFLLKRFSWTSGIEHYEHLEYNFQLKQNERVNRTRGAVFVQLAKAPATPAETGSVLRGLWQKFFKQQPAAAYEPGYFDFIELKFQYLNSEQNDIRRQLSLQPHDPEYWLGFVCQKAFRYFDLTGETDKRLVIHTMESLLDMRYNFGPMTYLLIGTTLLAGDKTVRNYAAELWIKGVSEGVCDSRLLGEVLGAHEREGLAPLKRLTDILLGNMLGLSAKHNQALEALIHTMLAKLPAKPPANLRKLLEVYLEVLAANKTWVKDEIVLGLLRDWAEQSGSLKPVVEKIAGLGKEI